MKFKRKKVTRQKGSKTHGWGAMKKHRGAGNRGGRGMAGSGKRADQKKPSIIEKYGNAYLGKKGFKNKTRKVCKSTNIAWITQNLTKLLQKNLVKQEKESYTIELKKLGFNKLLGTGKINKKFNITTAAASEKAIKKIQEAGGTIIVTQKKEG